MDADQRGFREIGRRVLELLAGIDLERPQVDEERAAEHLRAYADRYKEQGRARPVRWLPDLHALRLWPGHWSDINRGERHFWERRLLLDERGEPFRGGSILEHRFPEVQMLANTDRTVLATGIGASHHVAGVRWVTAGLSVRGRQLAEGTVQPRSRSIQNSVHGMAEWSRVGWVRSVLPLAEAAAAGLFAFAVGKSGNYVAVSRPRLRLDAQGRLHDWDGLPAVEWPGGRGMYFWRGVAMSDAAGSDPGAVTPGRIARWANAERRRVAIERIGLERFTASLGAQVVQQDDYGRLWKTEREIDGEPFVVVEVVNATREADGSRRRYFLRVPPETSSARAAIAWSFGMDPDDYRPAVET